MKKRMSALVVIVAIVAVGFAVRALSTSSPASSAHRELVERLDSKTSKVELFGTRRRQPTRNCRLSSMFTVSKATTDRAL